MTDYQPHIGCEYFILHCQFQPFNKCERTNNMCGCCGDMRLCPYFPDIQSRGRQEEKTFVSEKAKEPDYISRSTLLLDLYKASKTYNEPIPAYIYQTICKQSGGIRC